MCGICGLISLKYDDAIPVHLSKMNYALLHRGPDDAGEFSNLTCGIAMRRLSIIDLLGGHQPIFNETGDIGIVFNGEIYNFRELQEVLHKRNHNLQTQSDTEVILHLYEDEQENTPTFLKGMFAFCIYEQDKKTLFLARDRFGEKPLYYYTNNGFFAFSSEIASLLQCTIIPRQLNHEALGYYLRMGFAPTPLTLFKDIHILPPGHWLKWQNGEITTRAYYTVDYCADPMLEHEADAIDAVRSVLHQAVKRQSLSDVPLGAFLSGGIDSSSVVAMLQANSSHPIKTFTARFEEASYDESTIARQVAQHLGTEHHEFVIPNIAFEPEDLWRIIEHIGQPFHDTSAIPTYLLSKQIREEVTVALSGDGGDEMFAGYPIFQWGQRIQSIQKLPNYLLKSASCTASWLSHQRFASKFAPLRQIRRGLEVAASPQHLLPIMIHASFEPLELSTLVKYQPVLDVAIGNLPLLTILPPEAENWTPLRRLMYFRLKYNLNDDMLTKVDRMSMAASIEVRAPMLDPDLAELSMRLPDKHLIQQGVGKSILRKAIKGMVPEIVFTHPKSGFSIPLHKFQNDKYKQMATELLHDRTGVMQLFSSSSLNKLLHDGLNQQSDNAMRSVFRTSHQLWSIVQLAAWAQRFEVRL